MKEVFIRTVATVILIIALSTACSSKKNLSLATVTYDTTIINGDTTIHVNTKYDNISDEKATIWIQLATLLLTATYVIITVFRK